MRWLARMSRDSLDNLGRFASCDQTASDDESFIHGLWRSRCPFSECLRPLDANNELVAKVKGGLDFHGFGQSAIESKEANHTIESLVNQRLGRAELPRSPHFNRSRIHRPTPESVDVQN
jgi:hypothetical protein